LQLADQKIRLEFVNPVSLSIPPVPVTALTFDSDTPLTPEKLDEIRLFVNRIFRAYRLVTKQTFNSGTITQLAKHDFLSYVQYSEIDENGKLIGKPRAISYVHRLEIGRIEDEKFSEIRRLAESPDLFLDYSYDEILLQAKSFFDQENFRMALLEAVIALETVVSSIISRIATEKGISEGATEDFLIRVGLANSLEIVLKLAVPESLPAEAVILGCKGANSIRNGIMHKTRLSVSKREAEDAINNIEMFVSQVQSLMVR
jgi:hypothetical protein